MSAAICCLALVAAPSPAAPAKQTTDAVARGRPPVHEATACSIGQTSAPTPRTLELLRLRADALRQVEDEYRVLSERGAMAEIDYQRAAVRRLRAELELTPAQAERVEIRVQIVERLRRLEELSGAGGPNSTTARPRHLERRVERLEAEIDLERERQQPPRAAVSECRCAAR